MCGTFKTIKTRLSGLLRKIGEKERFQGIFKFVLGTPVLAKAGVLTLVAAFGRPEFHYPLCSRGWKIPTSATNTYSLSLMLAGKGSWKVLLILHVDFSVLQKSCTCTTLFPSWQADGSTEWINLQLNGPFVT